MAAFSIRELARRSGFIFEGAIRRTSAVASPGLEPTPAMAVVHVANIFKGPELLAKFAGTEITVELSDYDDVREGLHAVFFTNGLHFGEGLAVREVGRLDAKGPAAAREVREAMMDADDAELLDHVREAHIVVAGVAVHVGPAYQAEGGRAERGRAERGRAERGDAERGGIIGSEHDPDWWQCVIDVETMVKGAVEPVKGKLTVMAFFAHSLDVMWYRAPKFDVGDTGVWLLHRTAIPRLNPPPGPAAIHPIDFQPVAKLKHIRALVEREER